MVLEILCLPLEHNIAQNVSIRDSLSIVHVAMYHIKILCRVHVDFDS